MRKKMKRGKMEGRVYIYILKGERNIVRGMCT